MDGDPVARGQGEQRLLYHFRVGVRPHGAGDDSRTQLGVSGQQKNRGDLFGAARRAEPLPGGGNPSGKLSRTCPPPAIFGLGVRTVEKRKILFFIKKPAKKIQYFIKKIFSRLLQNA